MPNFSFENNQIHYKVFQPEPLDDEEIESKSLVFLHGFLEDLSIWNDIIPSFQEEGYTCLTIDLPCHGSSRFDGEICSMSFMAETVFSLISFLNLNPDKIIGHSMGGYVALELTKMVKSEPILLHSNFWEDSPQKKIDRNRVIEIVKKNKSLFINEAIPGLFAPTNKDSHLTVIQGLIDKANETPANEICAATAGMRDRQAFYQLKSNLRVSIIHGDLDPIIQSEKMTEELQNISSSYLFTNMIDVGHMGIWEDPKTVISSIKSILFS